MFLINIGDLSIYGKVDENEILETPCLAHFCQSVLFESASKVPQNSYFSSLRTPSELKAIRASQPAIFKNSTRLMHPFH